MKSSQRLDYSNLAEILGQRGTVEPQQLSVALQASAQGTMPFPEALTSNGLITEWELARVVCDLYGLPFLPVEMYVPSTQAGHGLDLEFMRMNNIVPTDRFGQLLTVCLPGLVPAEVLGLLAAQSNLNIMLVVGTASGNRNWFSQNTSAEPAAPIPRHKKTAAVEAVLTEETEQDWSALFDEGDAAVHFELSSEEDEEPVDGGPP